MGGIPHPPGRAQRRWEVYYVCTHLAGHREDGRYTSPTWQGTGKMEGILPHPPVILEVVIQLSQSHSNLCISLLQRDTGELGKM